jgi:hypothetical protein
MEKASTFPRALHWKCIAEVAAHVRLLALLNHDAIASTW